MLSTVARPRISASHFVSFLLYLLWIAISNCRYQWSGQIIISEWIKLIKQFYELVSIFSLILHHKCWYITSIVVDSANSRWSSTSQLYISFVTSEMQNVKLICDWICFLAFGRAAVGSYFRWFFLVSFLWHRLNAIQINSHYKFFDSIQSLNTHKRLVIFCTSYRWDTSTHTLTYSLETRLSKSEVAALWCVNHMMIDWWHRSQFR